MLKATVVQPDGRRLVLIGLSEGNWRRLDPQRDEPLLMRGGELSLDFDLAIWSGKDDRTMAAQLKETYGIEDVQVAEPPPPATTPTRDDTDFGTLPADAIHAAIEAAHKTLCDHGIDNPAVVLIAQDDGQQRALAANVANPADLLRVTLWNLERRDAEQPPPPSA